MQFTVFYMKPDSFRLLSFGDILPTLNKIDETHAELMTIDAPRLADVFGMMQGHAWSPNGEARELIATKGLAHTSMSVGDIAREDATGDYYVCARMGWLKLAAPGTLAESLALAVNEATDRLHRNYKPGICEKLQINADEIFAIGGIIGAISGRCDQNHIATFNCHDGSRYQVPTRGL